MIRAAFQRKPTKRHCAVCPNTVAKAMDKYCSAACAKKDREQADSASRRQSRNEWRNRQEEMAKPRKGLRSRGPKMTPIRKSAKGEECTVNLPMGVCNFNTETTVLAHSNSLADGKGMGLKAPDTRAAYTCSSCHDVLDGRKPRPEGMTKEFVDACFEKGVERTHARLQAKGLM